MRLILVALVLAILALQVAATPVKRDDNNGGDTGYTDPTASDGRMLTVVAGSKNRNGEPLNVIVSNKSDPWVLSQDGFTNYSRSLNFRPGDCSLLTFGSNQRANLGDGNGARVQDGIQRYGDGCKEPLTGGNHFRFWLQKSGAVFIAASVEENKDKNHMIVDNGYDLGRDQLVGNATQGTTKDAQGNEYKTSVAYNKSLMKGIKAKDINHNIGTDGRVAVLTVQVTKRASKSAGSRAAVSIATTIFVMTLAIIQLV